MGISAAVIAEEEAGVGVGVGCAMPGVLISPANVALVSTKVNTAAMDSR